MKKKVRKKMGLSKETLLRLDSLSLMAAAGASSETLTEPSCRGTNVCTNCTVCASCFETCQIESGVCGPPC